MKACLYALRVNNEWQWRVTIELQIDFAFWFHQYKDNIVMVLIEPHFSLGQAIVIRDQCMMKMKSTSRSIYDSKNQIPEISSLPLLLVKKVISQKASLKMASTIKSSLIKYNDWLSISPKPQLLNPHLYQTLVKNLLGRSQTMDDLEYLCKHLGIFQQIKQIFPYLQYAYLCGEIEITHGLIEIPYRSWKRLWKMDRDLRCRRCGSGLAHMHRTACQDCNSDCYYCEACLMMGRSRFCSLLVYGLPRSTSQTKNREDLRNPSEDRMSAQQINLNVWIDPFQLSPAQKAASIQGLGFMESDQRRFLIWAVTGAGKTEMIFPFILFERYRGGNVLIATPRKDVVLELLPRIKKAFGNHRVVALYGGSTERFEQGDITIATTHQLFRFHKAFDLAIIDEMDAFPYHNNPMLEFAVDQVVKDEGQYLLLSATPPAYMRKQVSSGKLPHVRVPVRFHRYPLPVPQFITTQTVNQYISKQEIPKKVEIKLQISVERGAQLFIFVPAIKLVEPMVNLIRKIYRAQHFSLNHEQIEGTSSKDPDRQAKVNRFREKQIRILVTTTILERGITIPFSDVYIFDADSRLFDEAALVQMAGRAGRSIEDPSGKVYFIANEVSKSQSDAKKQIVQMNRWAKRLGYLRGKNDE